MYKYPYGDSQQLNLDWILAKLKELEALIGDDLAVVDVRFDTSGTNGKIQQKYHDQYHDVVEVDYTPIQNSKRPLSSDAGYVLNDALRNEELNRQTADAANNSAIVAERTARENADTSLNTAITGEITARQNADTAMTAEINSKMNKPTNAGTANQILRSNGDGTSTWGNAASTTEIDNAVSAWLTANVPTGQTVAIDSSLTVNGAAANSKTVGDIFFKDYYNRGPLPAGSDLNNLTTDSVYQILSNAIPTHSPKQSSGTVITNNYYQGRYLSQFWLQYSTLEVYYRKCSDGNWSDWVQFPDIDLSNVLDIKTQTLLNQNTDCDTIQENSIRAVRSGTRPPHWALGATPGLLFTVKYYTNIYEQIAFPYFNYPLEVADDATRHNWCIAYRRLQNGVWLDWVYSKQIPRNHDATYYAFGDSVAYGYSADHNHDKSPYNYPSLIGDLIGIDVQNSAVPAQGLIGDWNTILSTIETLKNSMAFANTKLVTLGWNYNDSGRYAALNFGNPNDPVPTSTSGITTWLGYYNKILDILQESCPQAVVVLITGHGWATGSGESLSLAQQFTAEFNFLDGRKTVKQMYDALEELCYAHGYNCINQAKGTVVNSANVKTLMGDHVHMNYNGYRTYGNFIAAKVASIFQNI